MDCRFADGYAAAFRVGLDLVEDVIIKRERYSHRCYPARLLGVTPGARADKNGADFISCIHC
jgi:hypothetical protein